MNESMSKQEKILYHQIHPLKLLADWVPGLGSIYLMWRHNWRLIFSGLLVVLLGWASGLLLPKK